MLYVFFCFLWKVNKIKQRCSTFVSFFPILYKPNECFSYVFLVLLFTEIHYVIFTFFCWNFVLYRYLHWTTVKSSGIIFSVLLQQTLNLIIKLFFMLMTWIPPDFDCTDSEDIDINLILLVLSKSTEESIPCAMQFLLI